MILITFLFGILADAWAIRPVIIGGTAMMLVLGAVIAFLSMKSSWRAGSTA